MLRFVAVLLVAEWDPRRSIKLSCRRRCLNGVLDWGDLTSGDVATDLASIWMLFDGATARREYLRYYGSDDELVSRAMGWAVFFATVFLEVGAADHSFYSAIGRAILDRLHHDVSLD